MKEIVSMALVEPEANTNREEGNQIGENHELCEHLSSEGCCARRLPYTSKYQCHYWSSTLFGQNTYPKITCIIHIRTHGSV